MSGKQQGPNSWRVLVVDDDPDVHSVTRLVLKNKLWRDQGFELTSVHSQAEAEELLHRGAVFHVAVVDVVMERQDSGLDLCRTIRTVCPRSTRIVLRTGQAGTVPEETVLNEYDIDYYLHKLDMDPAKLFSVVRACLRSSQDISTLLAYGKQLQSFTKALQHVSTADDLKVFMGEALQFLELKHNCTTVFNYDLGATGDAVIATGKSHRFDDRREEFHAALRRAHHEGLPLMVDHPGPRIGLDERYFAIAFEAREEKHGDADGSVPSAARGAAPPPAPGGLVFVADTALSDNTRRDLAADARLFIENWCIAYSTLRLRERLSREQRMRDEMYQDRLESIAAMVTGVAHELNTPLGVARTAGSMVGNLSDEVLTALPETEAATVAEAVDDLRESVRLMNKNLDRAHRLIQSFRKLSSSQLSDQPTSVDLRSIVDDCVETIGPELKKNAITVSVDADPDTDLVWQGFPGHLSQILVNLLQNAMRYAYEPGTGGPVDIALNRAADDSGFRVTFADHGRGVSEEIKPRMFEPFVTSGRELGGTGLGLAIIQNIVTNLLDGAISCESGPGEGTKFVIDLPLVCKEAAPGTTHDVYALA
ncbi:HAMP domain-containing sensor histidine kinase [Streptomyces sp. NPDC005805]|uniref:sensor histidine kinase n=1 Tax=Streptomyces sp. NPDC005805 TaxID=3157068 RepID=UPI0033EBD6A3